MEWFTGHDICQHESPSLTSNSVLPKLSSVASDLSAKMGAWPFSMSPFSIRMLLSAMSGKFAAPRSLRLYPDPDCVWKPSECTPDSSYSDRDTRKPDSRIL